MKQYVSVAVLLDSLYRIKYLYLVSLLVITNILLKTSSNPNSLDVGNLMIWSKAINPYSYKGTSSNYRYPQGLYYAALMRLYS